MSSSQKSNRKAIVDALARYRESHGHNKQKGGENKRKHLVEQMRIIEKNLELLRKKKMRKAISTRCEFETPKKRVKMNMLAKPAMGYSMAAVWNMRLTAMPPFGLSIDIMTMTVRLAPRKFWAV